MATFNSIHGKTLERVLLYAIRGFSTLYSLRREQLEYFGLAWVCREWRRMLLPKLYKCAFITIMSTSSPAKSNIRLIVDNGLSKYAQHLHIRCPSRYIASGHLIKLLDERLFHKANWSSIYNLGIYENLHSPFINSRRKVEISADMCDTANQYLHTYLPTLTSITIIHPPGIYTTHPLARLANLKLHQLSTLNISGASIIFTHHSFSSSLTHLTLRLSSGQTTLPHIATRNLRTLELLDIPSNFSWRCFSFESNDSFYFSELESMTLRYSTTPIDWKTVISSHSTTHPYAAALRKIHMPKLKRLLLSDIPPSDTHLFAPLLLLHLDSLHIVSTIDVLTQMNLCFPFSKEVSIRLSNNSIEDTQMYNTFTETIFSSFSVATKVAFEVEHYIPVSINTVCWLDLQKLDILAFISRTTLYRLLSQLPLLEELRVKFITTDGEQCQYDKQHGISLYSPDNSINCNLRYLECFYSTSHFPLVFDLYPLYEFIANVVTLKEVRVPEFYLQDTQDHFNQDSMQEYPHIHNILFVDSFERFYRPPQ
ncbi:hypothetical protein DL89DRAFT_266946 [Linderina pennispora]|uniref:F-box domain-containing protein n=1 Tax=Linderina pennispora TaxID=61395 RepID=A0A1Y1WBB4_9FUNG|nr:uncharacterized protein DL89DRAFT_266946 [Linderina pennispora]ORX70830.1 hypothetical protein DL89DRAFT_266946 [Linderina pennispora]